MGTTAPCNTGAAKTGFLLLGNTVGRIWFRAVPRVFGWPVRSGKKQWLVDVKEAGGGEEME